MKGSEWATRFRKLGYDRQTLMRELDVKSRQTLLNWEKADTVPRLAELALYAIERDESCRRMVGKPATARQRREARRGDRGGDRVPAPPDPLRS